MGSMFLLIGIFVLLFGNIGEVFFFSKKSEPNADSSNNSEYNDLLCRFVTDGSGGKIGESVTIDEDILIIKKGKRFLGVPLKHIEDNGKTILVKGVVDFEKAFELGEKWRRESFREMNQKDSEG